MGANREFTEFVADLLAPLGDIERKMFFGGVAFKSHGSQFAMIMGHQLYFCVNKVTRPGYEALGMKPFNYSTRKGIVQVRKYFSVPEDVLENHEQIILWAQQAIQSAKQAD